MMSSSGRFLRLLTVGAVAGVGAAALVLNPAVAAAGTLVHKQSINLGNVFTVSTGYGDYPISVGFDGTNAYVGGYNASTATNGTVGVVKIANVASNPTETGLPGTVLGAAQSTGFDFTAWSPTTNSLVVSTSNGTIARMKSDNSGVLWSKSNVNGGNTFGAMAIDPKGDNGNPGVAFVTWNSGRRQLLSLADGSTIYDSTNGAILTGTPSNIGYAWRGLAFDSNGDIALTGAGKGYAYGKRTGTNQFTSITGTANHTTGSVLSNPYLYREAQGVAILQGMGSGGSNLLAFSGKNITQTSDMNGNNTISVNSDYVQIRNLDGSTTNLSQTRLTGNENGIGTAWTADQKNLAYGLDANGTPTLLVLDLNSKRLDVYQASAVPEPASLLLLGLGGLLALPRRRRQVA